MHSSPPYLGAGSVQRRLRFWTPPPQVAVQVFQRDQGPHPPLTRKIGNRIISILCLILKRNKLALCCRSCTVAGLTRTRRLLANFSFASLSLTVSPAHLGRGGVAEADACNDALAAGHGAGGPGRPVAPATVLFNCEQHTQHHAHPSVWHKKKTLALSFIEGPRRAAAAMRENR